MAHLSTYRDDDFDSFAYDRATPRASASGWYLRITSTCLILVCLMMLGDFVLGWVRNIGVLDGRSSDRTPITIRVGEDVLAIPANMFRFENQRVPTPQDHVELVVRWPTFQGYDGGNRSDFLNGSIDAPLIFMTIFERESPGDSASRLATVYQHYFEEGELPAPEGLIGHRLRPESGLAGEEVYFEAGSTDPFTTHCLPLDASGYPAPCLTEIHVGRNLAVQLRFRSGMLRHWSGIKSGSRVLLASFGLPIQP